MALWALCRDPAWPGGGITAAGRSGTSRGSHDDVSLVRAEEHCQCEAAATPPHTPQLAFRRPFKCPLMAVSGATERASARAPGFYEAVPPAKKPGTFLVASLGLH